MKSIRRDIAFIATAFLVSVPSFAAPLYQPGDIVLYNPVANDIERLAPGTGQTTPVASTAGLHNVDLTFDSSGELLVGAAESASNAGVVLRIDPNTGAPTTLFSLSSPNGTVSLAGVTQGNTDYAIAIDGNRGASLIAINLTTGTSNTISTGGFLGNSFASLPPPQRLDLLDSTHLITNFAASSGFIGSGIVTIDLSTGFQSLLKSGFKGSDVIFRGGVSYFASSDTPGGVFRLDAGGILTLITPGTLPSSYAMDALPDGTLAIIGSDNSSVCPNGAGCVMTVNPITGAHQDLVAFPIGNFSNAFDLSDLAVVPAPEPATGLLLMAGLLGLAAGRRRA